MPKKDIDLISVIVPDNPFPPNRKKDPLSRCMCALDIEKHLMKWWPGTPHFPERHAKNVRAIQRTLDWKRVAQIAAYLLQEDLKNVSRDVERYFGPVYQPKKNDPGREWPPRIPKLIRHQESEYPEFGDILVHINGARLKKVSKKLRTAFHLVVDTKDKGFHFSVIDGQHRINGAFLALKILQAKNRKQKIKGELAATVYINLDPAPQDGPPRNQAQLFIDVNFNQKKVDRSLVYDLFPTARNRAPADHHERSQDLARQLMLEVGPLVGMIQIPGIRYGVKGVVALATLAGAIEGILDYLDAAEIRELRSQAEFLAQFLLAWLNASGWEESAEALKKGEVDPDNVVYQGRVLVSVLALTPAAIKMLREKEAPFISAKALGLLTEWSKKIIHRARLEGGGRFVDRNEFKSEGFLGSGGIGRFRNLLWAATKSGFRRDKLTSEQIEGYASSQRAQIQHDLPPQSELNDGI